MAYSLSNQNCAICLELVDNSKTDTGHLECTHFFCFTCIRKWSKTESTCPLCKSPFNSIVKHFKGQNSTKTIKVKSKKQPVPEHAQEWGIPLDPFQVMMEHMLFHTYNHQQSHFQGLPPPNHGSTAISFQIPFGPIVMVGGHMFPNPFVHYPPHPNELEQYWVNNEEDDGVYSDVNENEDMEEDEEPYDDLYDQELDDEGEDHFDPLYESETEENVIWNQPTNQNQQQQQQEEEEEEEGWYDELSDLDEQLKDDDEETHILQQQQQQQQQQKPSSQKNRSNSNQRTHQTSSAIQSNQNKKKSKKQKSQNRRKSKYPQQ